MPLSWYGWCAEKFCREMATSRIEVGFVLGTYQFAVCDDHLVRIKADMQALEGHDIALVASGGTT